MMGVLCMVLSLPVSILLVRYLMKKKTGVPFQKRDVFWLLGAGILSMLVAAALSLAIAHSPLTRNIGSGAMEVIMGSSDNVDEQDNSEESAEEFPKYTFGDMFLSTLCAVGLVEELSRYLFLQLSIRNKKYAETQLDMVICGGIVGLGFNLLEDIIYVNGSIVTVIFRAITPFHFTFGVIMGYFIGKAMKTGNKFWHVPAILIPALLHTLFDCSFLGLSVDDYYILPAIVFAIVLIALTIIMILKIKKWSKAQQEQTEAQEPAA